MYKQNPKSPVLKALKGNQGKLPQHLQDAIKAAPESPAKQTKDKGFVGPHEKRQMGPIDKYNPHKPGSAESEKHRRDYNAQFYDARAGKLKAGMKPAGVSKTKSPAKQTTAGEFAHKQSLKDKEMGKSTKVVDKFTSALEAPFSDKTYSELKKEKRAKQKAKYNAKSPAKQTSPGSVTTRKKRASLSPKESNDGYRKRTGHNKPPVGPKAEKPKTKKEVFVKKVNKKRYK